MNKYKKIFVNFIIIVYIFISTFYLILLPKIWFTSTNENYVYWPFYISFILFFFVVVGSLYKTKICSIFSLFLSIIILISILLVPANWKNLKLLLGAVIVYFIPVFIFGILIFFLSRQNKT